MRIVQVVPGSGDNFYCENCVRDHALVRALHRVGHEVVVVPMYLPSRIDELDEAVGVPIFFGGINTYLQQRFGLFRKTPRWVDRLLDSRMLLGLAARRAGSVRPSGLGEMTLSMLRGRDGNQAKELERLLEWLEGKGKPDVVHLSNPLLLGIGSEIKRRLGVPIVCSLQDEDAWLDALTPPYVELCWEAMANHAQGVDDFVAVSRYFGEIMRGRMHFGADRLHVVHIGVKPGPSTPAALPLDPPVLGYLARTAESLGLGILVQAFLKLRGTERLRNLRLHVSGGATADDAPFLKRLKQDLAAHGADGDVTFFDAFDPSSRRTFFESLTLLSVPARKGLAFGTFLLESLAAGVPVVQPRIGSFPELVEATGGGVLYDPNDADTLARAIDALLSDRERLAELGRQGRQSVAGAFSMEVMAERTLAVYRGVGAASELPAGSKS